MATRNPVPRKKLTLKALERSALFQLERRALTTAQLRRMLARKTARSLPCDDAPAWIDDVIERCTRSGLLDDARVAAAKVASMRTAGKSTRAIAVKLRQKGVDATTATTALANDDGDDLAAAMAYVKKRRLLGRDKQKALAALCRQGFTFSVAKRALEQSAQAATSTAE